MNLLDVIFTFLFLISVAIFIVAEKVRRPTRILLSASFGITATLLASYLFVDATDWTGNVLIIHDNFKMNLSLGVMTLVAGPQAVLTLKESVLYLLEFANKVVEKSE